MVVQCCFCLGNFVGKVFVGIIAVVFYKLQIIEQTIVCGVGANCVRPLYVLL